MTLDIYSHAQDRTKEANLIERYAWTQAANSQPRENFGTLNGTPITEGGLQLAEGIGRGERI